MWTAFLERVDGSALPWAVVCAATLAAAVTDLRTRRIHNLLTVPLFVVGLSWAAAIGGLPRVVEGLAASAALGFPFVLLFLFARGGAGDAKLMIALGPWTGLAGGLLVLVAVLISGMIVGIVFALLQRRVKHVAMNLHAVGSNVLFAAGRAISWRQLFQPLSPTGNTALLRMPYGLAICIGTWIAAAAALRSVS